MVSVYGLRIAHFVITLVKHSWDTAMRTRVFQDCDPDDSRYCLKGSPHIRRI